MACDCVQSHLAINLFESVARVNKEREAGMIIPMLSCELPEGVIGDLGPLRDAVLDLERRYVVPYPREGHFHEGIGDETPGESSISNWPVLLVGLIKGQKRRSGVKCGGLFSHAARSHKTYESVERGNARVLKRLFSAESDEKLEV